jgi:uncharacterized protein (DUF58 family)
VLTDRGRWVLAFGGGVYLAAWAFGSDALYPIALGLVLAVGAAALWVRFLSKPMTLNRILPEGQRFAGDDVPVRLEVDVDGRIPSGSLVIREQIARIGQVETVMVNRRGRLRGNYRLESLPRGRYPVEVVSAVLEDPFGLESVEAALPAGDSLLVYPRLVDLDQLFSDSGGARRSSSTPHRARISACIPSTVTGCGRSSSWLQSNLTAPRPWQPCSRTRGDKPGGRSSSPSSRQA